jgi:FdhD protein
MNRVAPVTIQKIQGEAIGDAQPDLLAVEEPLEIRLGYGEVADRQQRSLSVTMRTPGHDLELALGFLFTEGIIQHRAQVRSLRHCTDLGRQEAAGNIVRVELQPDVRVSLGTLARNFYTTSSCGICGKASIEAVRQTGCPVLPRSGTLAAPALIHQLPARVRASQAVFDHTGGLHAAALFTASGELLLLREDVGRHNALDKVIGAALQQERLPCQHGLLFLSGRISFELVQKALMGGIPLVAAVGAPSSLAVQMADEVGMTLVGFVRNGSFNVYTHGWRLSSADQAVLSSPSPFPA